MRGKEDRREGHAWVTAEDRPDLSVGEAGSTEMFVWS
jgi:hypothetical protein